MKWFRRLRQNIEINKLFNVVALSAWLGLAYRAISTLDLSYDSLFYHLPFASRLVGIYPADEFTFSNYIESIYLGFPQLGEFLQGVAWAIFGTPNAGNLVNLVGLFLLVILAQRLLKLPFWQLTLYMLSVPLVLIHSVTSFMDLLPAALVTISLVVLIWTVEKQQFTLRNYTLIILPLAIALNTKYQIAFVVAMMAPVIAGVFVWQLRDKLWQNSFPTKLAGIYLLVSVMLVGMGCLSFAKNYAITENPVYPLSLHVGSIEFEGTFTAETTAAIREYTTPQELRDNPDYLNYIFSVLEFYNFNANEGFIWSVDQGQPSGNETGSFRAGGFFVMNLLVWGLTMLFLAFRYPKDRYLWLMLGTTLGMFAINGFFPQARLLRYWLYLPLFFIIFLLLVQKRYWDRERSLLIFINLLQVILFVIVLRFTAGAIRPNPYLTDIAQYELQTEQKEICIVNEPKDGFLYKLANPELDIELANGKGNCEQEVVVTPGYTDLYGEPEG